MSIYEELGVRTIINVSGASTRVSGPLMPPEVAEAMVRASQESVSMMELQAVASEKISEVTGAEAGYIISGASAGLTLGTATILAGMDPGRMDRLPDTTGMKNEFIIARETISTSAMITVAGCPRPENASSFGTTPVRRATINAMNATRS